MLSNTSGAYSGTRASYVALSAMSILALALLTSMWTSDVSGSVALLGLIAIYMASQELLMLFMIFTPLSILIDIIRLSGVPHSTGGRGWLIFIQLLEMAAKAAGALFAWSLHRSVGSGEEGMPGYAAVGPPSYAMGGPGPSSGPGMASAYGRVDDPFSAAYAPPNALPQSSMASSQPAPPSAGTFRPPAAASQPPPAASSPLPGSLPAGGGGPQAPAGPVGASPAAPGGPQPASGNIITLE